MPDASAAPPTQGSDWPAEAADRIVDLVEKVRDKTAGPAETVARGIVYGVLAGLAGLALFVLLIIASVRGLDRITEHFWHSHETYLAYAFLALVFTVVGMVMWSKRRVPAAK